ncbi:S9 family peptidase [Porticoccus sp. W117]|uniref:S9 family peptidase n=1 Tax=Porticoccus sp. W117 TaxID=3054777 RepID=UPI002598C834|nr:S9 family peptidase [Porticoccus sp. W117]MDM3871151.1 S9 family peptidase [Porticoccus sp. W117]
MPKLLSTLIMVGALLTSPWTLAEKRPMTLDDIARVSQVTSVASSPDGQWVAYTKGVQRTPYKDDDGPDWGELHISDTQGNSRPFVSGSVNVAGIKWSADSQHLYYLAKRYNDKFISLYRIPLGGGESVPVYTHTSDIIGYDINGSGVALLLTTATAPKDQEKLIAKGFQPKVYEEQLKYNQLYRLNLNNEGAKAEQISVEGHLMRIAWNPKGDSIIANVSPTPLVDDTLMKPKVVILGSDGKVQATLNGDGKVGNGHWAPNGNDVAYIGSQDTHDPREGIVKYYKSGKTTELQPGLLAHTQDIEFLPGGDLLALNHIGTGSEVVILNPGKPGKGKKLNTGKRIVRSLSTPKKGRGFAFVADAPNHPREAFWYQGGKVTRLSNSNPWLDDVALGKQESITWKAEDGTEIQGVLVYPLDYKKGQKYPLINFVHGGPEAHISNGWHSRYSEPVHVFAGKGYFSLWPNYRGSTGRGVDFSKEGQHAYADPEFLDIVAGKDYLVDKGMVDPTKVGITGGSYGGFATAWSSTALSEHYQAAVMFVGISNQLSKFGTTDIPNEMHLVHARAWPWDDFQWMLERSPIYHAQKHRTPLLIMHGEADPRVHPAQSLEMYRYLKTLNNAPVRLVLYPGEGHGNRKVGGKYDYSLRLLRWMDHYLTGPGGKPPEQDLKHEERLEKPKPTPLASTREVGDSHESCCGHH